MADAEEYFEIYSKEDYNRAIDELQGATSYSCDDEHYIPKEELDEQAEYYASCQQSEQFAKDISESLLKQPGIDIECIGMIKDIAWNIYGLQKLYLSDEQVTGIVKTILMNSHIDYFVDELKTIIKKQKNMER